MNTPKYAEYMRSRGEPNSLFLIVFKAMQKNGELETLTDQDSLEKVVLTCERLIEKERF